MKNLVGPLNDEAMLETKTTTCKFFSGFSEIELSLITNSWVNTIFYGRPCCSENTIYNYFGYACYIQLSANKQTRDKKNMNSF